MAALACGLMMGGCEADTSPGGVPPRPVGTGADAGVGAGDAASGPQGSDAGPAQSPDDPPSGPTQLVRYERDDQTDFLNPERGWMRRGSDDLFERVRAGDDDHPAGYSVVWTDVGGPPFEGADGNPFRLDNYRADDLPASLLQRLRATFERARAAGVKLKVRFAYNYDGGGADATKGQMLRHIEQLGPVLSDNADAIASLDTGLIGKWGEMHGSQHIEDTEAAEIVRAWLDVTPDWLNVLVRYPRVVRALFGDDGYHMDLSERFSGTDQSRVGWYNDCLWSSEGNTGTYRGDGDSETFRRDRDTFETVGRFAATSGESCNVGGDNAFNDCQAVLADMALIQGPDTLFRGFWKDMYDKWIRQGCYDEVSRRLGYRINLVSATLPVQLSAGGSLRVQLELENTGFGKVYNPRPLDLLLVGEEQTWSVRLSDDARAALPLAGERVSRGWTARAPEGLTTGARYRLFLRLPDPSPRLADDPRYALRLANLGVWDADLGAHDLRATVTVE